ncbi:hypothetical protein F183_A54870 (plasmid) [Bryobacterales bacterium F-183]|nr:hypothetical protein F183_A54870 [Bryobacterales bacterium F-183]
MAALFVAAPETALGQVTLRVTQGDQIVAVANGGFLTITSQGLNQQLPITLGITYVGSGTGINFQGIPVLRGSTDFTFLDPPPSNLSLVPGQTATLRLAFRPTATRIQSAEFRYDYTETFTEGSRTGIVSLGLNGLTPEFRVAYGFAIDGNVVPLPEQDPVIPFLPTPLNSSTLGTIIVANRGTGAGQLVGARISGDPFTFVSLPFLPANVAAGGSLSFQVRYRPRRVGTDVGTLTLEYANGVTYTITLTGNGITSFFTYELLPPEGPARPIVPNQTVVIEPVAVGQRATTWVRFTNTSELDINVPSIAVTGQSFSLADLPFLPLTVAPGETYLFSILYAPTQSGRQTGRLRIGNDVFELAADAIGPQLTYSYTTTAGTVTIVPLEPVVFTGVNVGETSVVNFTLENKGTAAAPIANIGIASDSRGVFSLANLPPLPSSIPPGGSVTFRIEYKPVAPGSSNASLLVNGVAFPLVAIANELRALPDYTITGPTTVQAFEQPRVGVTLASAYPVTLRGVLSIQPEADLNIGDPAVQFSTGGRQAEFTIPAGSTQAVFFNGATDIRFQSGSVAGTFFLRATFTTPAGLTLTPDNPKVLRITLAPTAPRLLTGGVSGLTSNNLTLEVAGVTTTRSFTRMTATFKARSGFNINQAEFTQDITGSSLLWFGSPASSAFGGQFTMQIPFAFSGSNLPANQQPTQSIESVTITLTNERGASNAITIAVPQ